MCVYIFFAGPHQKVEITFLSFDLRGTPPECRHEYLDLYAEVQHPDATELINSPFGGRFCGLIPPRARISLYRTIAFSFYTDKNETTPDVFVGRYTFINDSDFQVGTAAPNIPCTFTINSKVKRKGVIMSPTYPGAYPKPLFCSFLFLGVSGQRVHLEFRDFDLFSGGPHCPFDYVTVYDGGDNESAVIGTYCGQHRNLIIYSSTENLFVTFDAIQRTANTQNRGFKGIFEFSESFVKLDFIGKNGGEHILGTECDQKILSKKESNGQVFSPNYPFPYIPKTVCRYFIYGMQDVQNLERVRVDFEMFDIPKGDKTEKDECGDRYLKIYLKGQEQTDAYDKYDYEMCGENQPKTMISEGPRLVMIFASGDSQGRGFKAKYKFETEYLIPGTPAPDGSCMYTYKSTSQKKGEFNSPRYPGNYPSNTTCMYYFYPTQNEQVALIFDTFKVRADNANATVAQFGDELCQEDYVEIYNMYKDGSEIRIGRFCGLTSPGPIESYRGATGMKVLLQTDANNVFSGFKARYSFETVKSIFGDCGSNISHAEDGILQSTNYPIKYEVPTMGQALKTCNWFITVKPGHQILLNFGSFILEGNPAGRGCPAAVVRLWLDIQAPPIELCGEKAPNDTMLYMSVSNQARISFVVGDKSVGAEGFRLSWTEVSVSSSVCNEFKCEKSSYCIPGKLRCNNISNCGENDLSDEQNCIVIETTDWMVMTVTGAAIGGAVLLLLLCLMCQRREHQRRHRHMLPGGSVHSYSGHQHVCDELGQRFASVDSV
ncbi:tolloid-like protein 2 isoform X2 [Planococcus citri]